MAPRNEDLVADGPLRDDDAPTTPPVRTESSDSIHFQQQPADADKPVKGRAAKASPAPIVFRLPYVSEIARRVQLTSFKDITSDWLRDNEYLLSGHRCQCTPCECLASVCCLHNESMNIWTHIIGLTMAITCTIKVLFFDLRGASMEHYMNLASFLITGIGAFLFSAVFHIFMPVSMKAFKILSRMDYAGIAFHLLGANIPAVNYEFYCDENLRLFYTLLYLGAALGILAACSCDRFDRPEYRWIRATVFLTLGSAFAAPYFHKIVAYGFSHEETTRALPWYLYSALLYATGTALFAMRFPERFWPGKFDIWLHSHQLFHTISVPAWLCFFTGVSRAYEWRSTAICMRTASPSLAALDLFTRFWQ
eukprot:tig00021036_g17294.t1